MLNRSIDLNVADRKQKWPISASWDFGESYLRRMSITKDDILSFINEAEFDLKPTQNGLSVPIVLRIYKKMKVGLKFSPIKIENDLICDGHHRYIASLLAGCTVDSIAYHSRSPALDWKSIPLSDNDWDVNPGEVERLDIKDAEYNGMSLEELYELLK